MYTRPSETKVNLYNWMMVLLEYYRKNGFIKLHVTFRLAISMKELLKIPKISYTEIQDLFEKEVLE